MVAALATGSAADGLVRVDPADDLSVDQEDAAEHAVLAHQVLGGRDRLLVLLLLRRAGVHPRGRRQHRAPDPDRVLQEPTARPLAPGLIRPASLVRHSARTAPRSDDKATARMRPHGRCDSVPCAERRPSAPGRDPAAMELSSRRPHVPDGSPVLRSPSSPSPPSSTAAGDPRVVSNGRFGLGVGRPVSPDQTAFFRAGHAHAGSAGDPPDGHPAHAHHSSRPSELTWALRIGAPLAAICVSGGFFGVAFLPGFKTLLYAAPAPWRWPRSAPASG